MTAVGDRMRVRFVALRAALAAELPSGSWRDIDAAHADVGLPRMGEHPNYGWGKEKYVDAVLVSLPDAEVRGVAERAMALWPEQGWRRTQNALDWVVAGDVQVLSALTRDRLAEELGTLRLDPRRSASEVLEDFHAGSPSVRFVYDDHDCLCVTRDPDPWDALFPAASPSTTTTERCGGQALFEAFAFGLWSDRSIARLLEQLVHPTLRRGAEQEALVQRLNSLLAPDGQALVVAAELSGEPVYHLQPAPRSSLPAVRGLVFASTGNKPKIGFDDAPGHVPVIVENAQHCLCYDDPVGPEGLTWQRLVCWWAAREGLAADDAKTRRGLGERLAASLASSPPELHLFRAYFSELRPRWTEALPALIPQVYVHFDPRTASQLERQARPAAFLQQRIDFLLLLPQGVRVVVEVDGQQHYATGTEAHARPSPEVYARTAAADRDLRLRGYEVYRFGGFELRTEEVAREAVRAFFPALLERHGVTPAA